MAGRMDGWKEGVKEVAHLFVGENEENSVTQLILREHPHQLLPGFIHTLSIITVHHKDQTCSNAQNSMRHHREPDRKSVCMCVCVCVLRQGAYPVCFGSSVSRGVGTYLGHPRPTQ